jgi:uncharacterized protein
MAVLPVLAACGGGGGGADPPPGPAAGGSIDSRTIASRSNGWTYRITIYLPPGDPASRASVPTIYLLDGESWFQDLVNIVVAAGARVIVVGIGSLATRGRDYVPPNTCTPLGGGHVAYFDFLRSELIPLIESSFGGDRTRRALLGHSHGGSFVYYALFAEASGAHTFHSYLASDTSIACMPATVDGWESAYAASNADLPVRLHVSHAGGAENAAFAQRIANRRYPRLSLKVLPLVGSHTGIIPVAFADALSFATAV